jgi:hypothetical protein
MPVFTYVHYDGSDEHILDLLSRLVANGGPQTGSKVAATIDNSVGNGNKSERDHPENGGKRDQASALDDATARRFADYVKQAAAYGSPSQQKAMLAWLKADGEILFSKLWKASGVTSERNYGGVGGSLTKNMIKANGPAKWYEFERTSDGGDWVYRIIPMHVSPLKRSFGLG